MIYTIIAIDGFSSCGKSTLAKALSKKLHYTYVDSGAMYRAVTLYFLRQGVRLDEQDEVLHALSQIHIDLLQQQDRLTVMLNGEDVSEEIRQMRVSEFVSEVSALKPVRRAMVAQQQAQGKRRNIIMDGRDIGTTVFPNAHFKFFMTADPAVRAERRFKELQAKGEAITMEEVIENLSHRDHIDTTREESPLTQAVDAIVIDNTHMTEQEQLQFVLDHIHHQDSQG